jgi:hypothetical protein
MRNKAILAFATIGVLSSCATTPDDTLGEDCVDAKCDGPTTFKGSIKDRKDAIALFLQKSKVSTKGVLTSDYFDILANVTKNQGCDDASIHTYVVSDDLLSGNKAEPRIISTACSTNTDKGSEFFTSLVNPADPRTIEMFAWDPDARKYNFYDVTASGTKDIKVDASPTRCDGCHTTPADLGPTGMLKTPIMNEMTKPWPHWNASPGFVSKNFDMPAATLNTPTWKKIVTPHLASASDFEQLIREGQRKVVAARVRARRDAYNLDAAMNLIRPMFCSEQVNYVSEEQGTILNSALVDAGMRNVYLQIRPDNWTENWINDQFVSYPTSAKELDQVPVRGNADIAAELALMSSGAITPIQVLQVRALDWQNPVMSDFRCGLWTSAKARFMNKKPTVPGTTTVEAIPTLVDAILQVDGVSIPRSNERVSALGLATPASIAAFKASLQANNLTTNCGATGAGACNVDVNQMGTTVDAYVKSVNRASLLTLRDARICKVISQVTPVDSRFPKGPVDRFGARPALPAVTCK